MKKLLLVSLAVAAMATMLGACVPAPAGVNNGSTGNSGTQSGT